jgi:hypothetical protein
VSTKGVFILRKDGQEKAMAIRHDAYPGGAGIDIVDLVKTTDLSTLYDCLTLYDEWDMPEAGEDEYPGEPEPFSYDCCRLAVKNRKRLWVSPVTQDKIKDSLFCEYAYVIDLNDEQLLFFSGGQKRPQEGNPYGTKPEKPFGMEEDYYPCRLVAVFPFRYLRLARSESIAHEMVLAAKDAGDIRKYSEDLTNGETGVGEDDYIVPKVNLTAALSMMSDRINAAMETMIGLFPPSKNRVRELAAAVLRVDEAVSGLERRIEIIK